MESLDFNEFIKQFFAEKYMDLTESGFELCADIPDDSYIMLIDPVLMRRCFENLLNNALKYNPPGTSIYISVQKIRREITIIVADDGSGIPKKLQKLCSSRLLQETKPALPARAQDLVFPLHKKSSKCITVISVWLYLPANLTILNLSSHFLGINPPEFFFIIYLYKS